MIRILLLTAYFYGILPLLLGYAIATIVKRRTSLPAAYVTGYVIYLALFETLTIWESSYASYSRLASNWKIISYVITILVVACVIYNIISTYRKGSISFLKPSREASVTALMTLVLVLLTVLFFVPHALDDTPELARLSIANNSFFSVDPSKETAFAATPVCMGYTHLFYAFGSTITGLNVTTLIHILLPVFMIPFFVCSYVTISKTLFPAEESSRDRFRFVWLILLFYMLMIPLEAHIAFTPYRNIWNGITLAASCLLPLFISVCIKLIRLFTINGPIKKSDILNSLVGLICLALSIRLCIRYGLILCSLFVIASIILILVYLIWCRHLNQSAASTSEGGAPS